LRHCEPSGLAFGKPKDRLREAISELLARDCFVALRAPRNDGGNFEESPMLTGLSHVSIVVLDLDAAARRLRETFGLRVGEARTNEQQGVRLAYVDLGNARIELMEPSRPDSPIAKFLERNPKGGIHHFSLGVDALDSTAASLRDHGIRILGDGQPQYNVAGERIAFLHPADFLGALVELEEHGPKAEG
jgi:methylmalonyl-CoA/ethylmalonyl-CoA epimerase